MPPRPAPPDPDPEPAVLAWLGPTESDELERQALERFLNGDDHA